MSTPDLKKEHEKAVCDQLLEALKLKAAFKRHGDDRGEPDVIYEIGGEECGIEVATAYYENSDARDEWTLARGKRSLPPEGYEFRSGGVLVNPDDMICQRIQQEINDKCAKTYGGVASVWLCIEQRAALSDLKSVAECVKQLTIPPGHGFAKIFLAYQAPMHEGGRYTVFEIQ